MVNCVWQWCPDIPWNIVLDVKMILGRDLCLNKYILSKAEWPPDCGWALTNKLKIWLEEKADLPQQGILSTDHLCTFSALSALPGPPADYL